MRVILGKARNLPLTVPEKSLKLRPSQDRVRQAIFNILGDWVNETHVLDLYAGTGALGIEALSRGAKTCDFVDQSQDACTTILKNLKSTMLEGVSDIFNEKVEHFLSRSPHNRFDLIILDPPYADIPKTTFSLLPQFTNPLALIVYLHGKKVNLTGSDALEMIPATFALIETRRYGATHVAFFQAQKTSDLPAKL